MINEYENLLRSIILEMLLENYSSYQVPPDRLIKWEEKRGEETKKNNGLCREPRLLYYSDFYDLGTIIHKNWETFKPVFLDKKRFDVFFKEISDYRNNIAHGRTLIRSEELLLEGILMNLKTQKAVFSNKNQNADDFFIRINKISDNLGNIWMSGNNIASPLLRVGDHYELLVEATDPKGREINYSFRTIPETIRISQKGNRLIIPVTKALIGRNYSWLVEVETPETEYRNHTHRTILVGVIP